MQNKKNQGKNTEVYGCELKIERVPFDSLRRNDLILFQDDIWRCQSVNMHTFQNLESKIHMKIPISEGMESSFSYLRVNKLQLIPKQWSYSENKQENNGENSTKIRLKGQELGLGPLHDIEVIGMRSFQELQVVRSQKERGRDMAFKVILCETKKQNCYLIAGIEFLS